MTAKSFKTRLDRLKPDADKFIVLHMWDGDDKQAIINDYFMARGEPQQPDEQVIMVHHTQEGL